MKNSRAILILKTFSGAEIKEFEKFLNSPFSGCKKFVVNFYKVLKKYHPEFRDKDIEKEKLFKKLYPGKKFNDPLLRRMTSDLIKYSEEYLRYKNFKGNSLYYNAALLNELRMRKLENIFINKFDNIMKHSEKQKTISPMNLLENFILNSEMHQSRTIIRDSKMYESFEKSTDAAFALFISALYSYINHVSSFSNEYKPKSQLANLFSHNFNLRSFLKSIEKNKSNYKDYITMICLCHIIMEDRNDIDNYNRLKILIEKKSGIFNEFDLSNCLIIMTRFCTYQNLHHDNLFSVEQLRLYNVYLDKKYFLLNSNYLQLTFCRNLVSICKNLGRMESIKDFIKNYSEYFDNEYKEDFINYCNALLLFYDGKYEQSLEHAMKVNIDKPVFKKDLKIIKMKIYFELGYYESLYSELDSFRHFLTNAKTVKKEILMRGKNFARFLSKLSQLKESKNKSDFHVLKKQIEEETSVNEKSWFIQKLSEP